MQHVLHVLSKFIVHRVLYVYMQHVLHVLSKLLLIVCCVCAHLCSLIFTSVCGSIIILMASIDRSVGQVGRLSADATYMIAYSRWMLGNLGVDLVNSSLRIRVYPGTQTYVRSARYSVVKPLIVATRNRWICGEGGGGGGGAFFHRGGHFLPGVGAFQTLTP